MDNMEADEFDKLGEELPDSVLEEAGDSPGPAENGEADAQDFDESLLVTWLGSAEPGKEHVPASFFDRPVFKDSSEKGWTRIPNVEHCGLSYHKSSKQWHARWGATNFAPTWGETTRSEQKALLLCVMKLWEWYLEIEGDEEAKEYREQLAAYNKTISF